ncbi:MAG: GatB/YqeY domain-containing protein [Patescibacteria group bacterium]
MQKKDLQEELKQSMLVKNEVKTSVLRMVLSAINYHEIQKGGAGYEATEEDVMSVIQKDAKQHNDSIEQFKNAGRQDLVDKETRELEILKNYLPQQMSEDEIKKLVEDAISQTGAKSIQDIGKVMGALMPKVKGKADGSLVSKIVKDLLT